MSKTRKMQRLHLDYLFKHRLLQILITTLAVTLTGLIVASSPFGRWLEEDIGLPWLFQLRGEVPSPEGVAVISIDQASANELGLPVKPRKWPRDLHGELVEKLAAHGATAIGFDIIFDETKDPQQNQRFARGMEKAGNVILFQYLKQREIKNPRSSHVQGQLEQLISPIEALSRPALGLAPFPLPKVPAKVNHFWLYKESLGDMPTLPVVMLQTHIRDLNATLLELIAESDPELAKDMRQIFGKDLQAAAHHGGIQNIVRDYRDIFLEHPQLVAHLRTQLQSYEPLSPAQRHRLLSLLDTYVAPRNLYLNFYGGLQSIKTIPYFRVLNSDPRHPSIDVRGRAVFVGYSEQFQPEQKDSFYTVFTEKSSGTDISGVEIIATAFANLLEQNAIRTTSGRGDMLILFGWALLCALVLRLGSGFTQIPLTLLLALAYGGIVYTCFSQHYLWLPFLNPLVIQLLLATLLSFLFKYREVQHERQNIRQAFGYHLPVSVVDQIARGVNHITATGEKVHGIIMSTDAQQYTNLSERLAPDELHSLMNRYYQTLFTPIRAHHGIISDVVGDAAMAIWASATASTDQYQQACLAALEAKAAIEAFNQHNPQQALPTRFGLDSGDIIMGHVGALDHYEYRAVGDIVNTASRIEGANKSLGTQLLVSGAVLAHTTGLAARYLGRFQLAGKQTAIELHEILASSEVELSEAQHTLLKDFAAGLQAFETQQWQQAEAHFSAHSGYDGPSQFYLARCQLYRTQEFASVSNVIALDKK